MRKSTLRYWVCQILGWGGWTFLSFIIIYLFVSDIYLKPDEKKRIFLAVLLIEFLCNLFATHVLRYGLKRIQWIRFSTNRVIILFIVSVTLTGLLSYYGAKYTAKLTGFSLVQYEKSADLKMAIAREKALNLAGTRYYINDKNNPKDSISYLAAQNIKRSTGWYRNISGEWQYEDQRKGRFWWDIIMTIILIALWLLLYMVWHYLERNRKDEVDKLSLEKIVKELELNTIKSHINPHFIFNSLNSIRALVDENPQRARTAITELSNILRSSMQVEKMETVPLHKELDIVKDYLALEYYDAETLQKIILRSSSILNTKITTDATKEIAGRSRGTPRVANGLLRRVRDFAQVLSNGVIDLAITEHALKALNVDEYGLDEMDNRILSVIIEKFKGGPVGITTIATAVGEETGTLEEVYEPFLIQEGFLMRTSRGREVTPKAYKHLGKQPYVNPKGPTLFS